MNLNDHHWLYCLHLLRSPSFQANFFEANVGWWCWWFMWQLKWVNYILLEQTAQYSKTTHWSPGCNTSIPSGFITAEVELSSPSQGLPMIVEIDHPGDDAMDCANKRIPCTDFQRNHRWSLEWHDFREKKKLFPASSFPPQKGHCWQSTNEKTRKQNRSSACKPESDPKPNRMTKIWSLKDAVGVEKENIKTFHRKTQGSTLTTVFR